VIRPNPGKNDDVVRARTKPAHAVIAFSGDLSRKKHINQPASG
jgi:hypothetical protein